MSIWIIVCFIVYLNSYDVLFERKFSFMVIVKSDVEILLISCVIKVKAGAPIKQNTHHKYPITDIIENKCKILFLLNNNNNNNKIK